MILLGIILLAVIVAILVKGSDTIFESPKERAGRRGEEAASNIIKRVLRSTDLLFNNVEISYDGRPTELDSVIVNPNGVFIIEVKNYSGNIVGSEDDFEWHKYHTTGAGNTYEKIVKNPIKQVRRQIYILAKYLDYYGVHVWVDGYALLLQNNSPVTSKFILSSTADIDRVLHTPGRNKLSQRDIDSITKLLS